MLGLRDTSTPLPMHPTKRQKTCSLLSDEALYPRRAECRLPPELMQHVARFLETCDAFFGFMEAFVDKDALGLLQHVWKLSTVVPRHDLWPQLVLDQQPHHRSIPLLGKVTPFYPIVHIRGAVDWTVVRQLSATPIAWTMPSPTLWHPSHVAPLLKIVSLSIQAGVTCDVIDTLFPLLPHLRTLKVQTKNETTTSALTCFLLRSNVTSLHVRGQDWFDEDESDFQLTQLTSRHIRDVTQWLLNTRVRSLTWSNFDWQSSESAMQGLYAAIFLSPSLLTFSHDWMPLPWMDTLAMKQPISIQSLKLTACELNAACIKSLSVGLVGSTVIALDISHNRTLGVQGLRHLTTVLPQTNIRTLGLCCVGMDDRACERLAAALPRTRIQHLNISGNFITHVGAGALAWHLPEAAQLKTLFVQLEDTCVVGSTALIESLGRRRAAPVELFIFSYNMTADEVLQLNALAARFPSLKKCCVKHSTLERSWNLVLGLLENFSVAH
ncbi:Aste57867_23696 [Aphanomyces stellatus]|uniref:Aste57867_23230 protein n=1 Tax=Aphanomyces stellatus TaxID=120398 RepID=A0A485LML4_9STRA|nr:hypothetical protein As57867_023624 [Aphanomyces stellatus]KAF0684816.1 hypothetical protein As57867_023159 [Aphanomyces stellatus]KAF0710920.1 hypothetical protein As57867_005429 [Aphanomyces stellatus]VFT82494.1 Aste57867_5442 [Aphanomyces stellatus]VFT99875.1 Aste57867_23230 [Aphanomyces stellatus]